MKVRWPLLAFLLLACAAYAGMTWWQRRPAVVSAPPRPASKHDPPAAGCTRVGTEPARGAALAADERPFHVWGPAAPARPVPIALLLHGWQSDGLGFQKWFRFEEQTRDAAYVVYPDAVRGLWDVVGSKDLDYLEHVLDQVARAYCVDRSRVLVFGFSYGAKMANHLGCKRPDLAQAVMAGAGSWVDRTPDCGAPLPVLVVNRTSDSSELAAWGHDAARRWAGVQACDRAETASPLGEGCTEFADCRAPGSVTWCEDAWLDPKWPQDWNHTVRENYRAMAWRWFQALPETR